MKTLMDLPFDELLSVGDKKEFICDDDYILTDVPFSKKVDCVAKKGDVILIKHCLAYGLVMHAVHGIFRF